MVSVKPSHIYAVFLSLLVISGITSGDLSLAGELKSLRVVDGKGLVRAYKKVDKLSTVIVTLNKASSGSIFLRSVDGVNPDMFPSSSSGRKIHFNGVSPGEWKIVTREKGVRVDRVQIE